MKNKKNTASHRHIRYAPITLSEQEGVRYLHFGTEWVQGAMRIKKPNWIELKYAQQMMMWMLFQTPPDHIVQLGLGTGALTKFCYQHFPETLITAVELNPAVIQVCHSSFALPFNDERLNVIQEDALHFVNDPPNHSKIDVLQIDLYDATARGPVLDTPEFYQACADCLRPEGMLTVNLFSSHPSYQKNIDAIAHAFDAMAWLPEVHVGNTVAIAFKTAPQIDFSELYQRAKYIKEMTQLPALSWVHGLKEWMAKYTFS
jgi:spermidine synthase